MNELSNLMQYPVIIGLSDAEELAVVDERFHDSLVKQFVCGGSDAERISHMQQLDVAFRTSHFHATVENHAPGVQLLAIVHHHRTGFFHVGKHHASAQGTAHRERHVGEGLQIESSGIIELVFFAMQANTHALRAGAAERGNIVAE